MDARSSLRRVIGLQVVAGRHDGVRCVGRSGSISELDLATTGERGGGHDLHDSRPTRGSAVSRALPERTNMAVAQRVEDVVHLRPGHAAAQPWSAR